ncbi:unnamed protein product [Linum tenue]|uniref:MATH domain-containing protein n=1 Tax=Linum tenue TaxID=586396 RepID=A0AAV0J0T1_9ROSI|nr:unnamed protein product [Linum tenue]
MAAKDQAVTRKETVKFTWRIENFSQLKEKNLFSDTFLVGGRKWRVSLFPQGNNLHYLSIYLKFADSETMPNGWSVPAVLGFNLIAPFVPSSTVRKWTKHNFNIREVDWGFSSFVPLRELRDPLRGFLVNDTLTIEAEVSTEAAALPATDELKVIEADDQPVDEAIKESLTETRLMASQATLVDKPSEPNGAEGSTFSPSSAQLYSRDIIEELSTVINAAGNSSTNADHGSGLLVQQREKLVGFLGMSLEAISQAGSLKDVEDTALQLADRATEPLEKTVLEYVVSNLAKFREVIPSSLSTIETSRVVELSAAQATKDLEVRLVHRKGQLSSLEAEVSKLGDEGTKLDAEIQQLVARKAKILDHRNSTAADLEKATQDASQELKELKKRRRESKQAIEDRMRAEEKLAQSNASWKLLKEQLGW